MAGLGFCIGVSLFAYAHRNNLFRQPASESYINGYLQCVKDIHNGSFQFVDDSTIVVHPLNDSIVSIVVNIEN